MKRSIKALVLGTTLFSAGLALGHELVQPGTHDGHYHLATIHKNELWDYVKEHPAFDGYENKYGEWVYWRCASAAVTGDADLWGCAQIDFFYYVPSSQEEEE